MGIDTLNGVSPLTYTVTSKGILEGARLNEIVDSKESCYRTGNEKINEMRRTRPLLMLFLLGFMSLLSPAGYGQVCTNCVSKNVTINNTFIADANGQPIKCVSGATVNAYLFIVVTTNTPQQGLRFSGTVVIGGVETNLSYCFQVELKGSKSNVLKIPTAITYTCGQSVTLKNQFIAWGTAGICSLDVTRCSNFTPQCFYDPTSKTVQIASMGVNYSYGTSGTCTNTTNKTLYFTSTVTNATPPYKYEWDFGDNTPIDITANPSHQYATAGTYTVGLTVTDASNPVKTGVRIKTSVVVGACCTSSLYPTSISASSASVCSGGSVTLTQEGGTLGTNANYYWYSGSCGGTAVGTGNSITITPSVTTTYYVRAEGTCGNTNCQEVTITVNPLPTAYNVTGGGAYCTGGSGVAIGLSNSQSGVGYQLLLNGVNSGTPVAGTGSPISFGNQTAAGTYTIAATRTASGCTNAMSGNATVVVNEAPAISTEPVSRNVCPTANAAFSVTATGTSLSYNWQVSTNGGTSFSNIINGSVYTGANTSTLAITNIDAAFNGYQYTVIVNGASNCSSAISKIATLGIINNIWRGITSVDWNTTSNWACNIPIETDDVFVPDTAKYMPRLFGNTTVRSLRLESSRTSLNLNHKTFTITGGSLTGTGKFIGSSASGLTLNGISSPVTLYFDNTNDATTNVLDDLTITSVSTVNLANKLYITGTFAPNGSTFDIAANSNLTLRSTSIAATARVAPVLAGGAINGEVTVERFIPARRAYRFLSPAVTTITSISGNWMEGGLNSGIYTRDNPKAGYATNITGAGAAANGFDPTITNNPSMFKYSSSNGWVPVANTRAVFVAGDAYSLLVRGDRSIDMSKSDNSPAPTNTILRATGSLKTGTITRNFAGASNGDYIFIGNPYASPVDFKKVFGGSTNITPTYYGWDPTRSRRGTYISYNLTSGSSDPTSSLNNTIQSGEAFFVRRNTTVSGAVTFAESYKTNGNTAVFRDPHPLTKLSIQLLLSKDEAPSSNADGVVLFFDSDFSTAIGDEDSYKFTNPDENLAINHNGTSLSMEGRPPVTADDTIALKIWQFRQKSYYLKLTGSNFSPEVTAFVNDNYLHKQTSIDLAAVTYFSFTIDTTTASFAKDRFSIVFKAGKPLPVTLTHIKAYQKDQGVQVDWTSETETNVDHYEIEKSANGQQFTKATVITATGNNAVTQTYGWLDTNPNIGSNFYRIKVTDKLGVVKYSNAVKVDIAAVNSSITILPNPIKGSVIQVKFANLEKGRYAAVLYNTLGQNLYGSTIDHVTRSANHKISIGRLVSKGTYTLQISKGDFIINERVIVE